MENQIKTGKLFVFLSILFERYLTIGEVRDIMLEMNEALAGKGTVMHPFVCDLSREVIEELLGDDNSTPA